jgi:hypothetical protein
MPMQRSKYPKDWEAISKRIREEAYQRSQCSGECGSHVGKGCGAPNGAIVHRMRGDPAFWANGPFEIRGTDWLPAIRVVLTVAHLNHDPADCRPENLRAMCQRCHLRYDAALHARNARATREKRTGQLAFSSSPHAPAAARGDGRGEP